MNIEQEKGSPSQDERSDKHPRKWRAGMKEKLLTKD